MAGSIVETLMSMLGPQVVGPIASRLGESTDTVQRGLQSGSAAMLAGIAAKADQPGFLSQIFSLVTNPANSPGALSSLASNLGSAASGGAGAPLGDLGSRFASSIFGSGQSAVTDAIGRFAGLGGGKASSLIAMAAPLVLGVLGQHVRENGLSAADLGNTLKAEAPNLQRFLPTGFRSLLGGVPNLAAVAPAAVAGAQPTAGSGLSLFWRRWSSRLLWFFNRSKAPAPEEVQTPAPAAAPAAALPAGFFTLKLPDGVELNVPQSGIENQLATFIADSSKQVDKTTWFNFDRLTFDTGKATLQSSSQEQLNNVAAILKAYPNVHVKVGGYTDNSGKAAANLKLSDDRAKNVMDALVAAGIDPSRLESKGYGDAAPGRKQLHRRRAGAESAHLAAGDCEVDSSRHEERSRCRSGCTGFILLLGLSALDDVEGEAGERGFFVARLHVEAGLVHGGDDLVEREFVVAGFVHGHAAGVDGFDCAHAVAFDAGNLHEAADGVAGHAEVVLHGDLGGVLDLGVGAVECGDQSAGGHRAGDADFALTADLRSGDAGVLFVEDADGGGGEEVAEDALPLFCLRSFGEAHVVVRDGGDDSGGAVGGRGDDSASGGVLFVDRHCVHRDPVHGGERIFGAFGFETPCQTRSATADVEPSGKDAFDCDSALRASLHRAPQRQGCWPGSSLPRVKVRGFALWQWAVDRQRRDR